MKLYYEIEMVVRNVHRGVSINVNQYISVPYLTITST